MPKKKKGNNRHRQQKKQQANANLRDMVFREDGQQYAQVVRLLGHCRLEAFCFDGTTRLAHIRGNMRRRVWIRVGDILLISLRDYQDEKADVIHRYSDDESRILKANNEIPAHIRLDSVNDTMEAPEDDNVDFDFDEL